MLRDGLTTNLSFTEYLQELSTEESDDLTIKLNSCGYPVSKNIEELINIVELFIEDHNLAKNISKEHLWLELLNNGYILGDRILLLSNPIIYGSDVEELQEYLSRLGFYSDPINSTFDSSVSKSVKLFQENRGLPVDGTVGLETAAEIRKLLRPTMNTSLNEAVKSFKRRTSNFSICFDIENRGDYKEQIGLYQKIKDFCNENSLNVSFSSEIKQDTDEQNSIEYVNKVNPTLFLSLRDSTDLKVAFFKGKHSSSLIGERISKKIESKMAFVSEGKSLSVLKNTKSVTLVISGNFYQYNVINLLANVVGELKEIYKD